MVLEGQNNAQTYSFEAGNVRHEHEWRVWQQAKLPPGKMLMPGVVSRATNLVEHPQLVADRILRYAAIAGRENVVAGTDCGLGGRVHADLAWAKLRALVEGACLASRSLWPQLHCYLLPPSSGSRCYVCLLRCRQCRIQLAVSLLDPPRTEMALHCDADVVRAVVGARPVKLLSSLTGSQSQDALAQARCAGFACR